MAEPKSRAKKTEADAKPEIKQRVFKHMDKVHHDLYKLEVAKMAKKIGLGSFEDMDDPAIWQWVEHCHFFHTVDSNGRLQFYSTQIGGHFHEMEIIPQGDDQPPILKCVSGPLVWGRVKRKGKFVKEAIPVSGDDHTHDITYLRSEVVERRVLNSAAALVETAGAPKSVPGISG